MRSPLVSIEPISLHSLMSGAVQGALVNPHSKDQDGGEETLGQGKPVGSGKHKNYKGFAAGVFSGISKLSGRIQVQMREELYSLQV